MGAWVAGLSSTMDETKIRQIDAILHSTEKLRLALEASPARELS